MVALAGLERDAFQPLGGSHFRNVTADGVPGETSPAPRGLPCLKRFQPFLGLGVPPIYPGECGYRDELFAAYAKAAFDELMLWNFAYDKDSHAHRDVARTGQISGNRLDRFKNDQRHSKQSQGGIRAQRNYPDAKTSEYPVCGNPVGEWSRNSHEDCIH